MGLDQPGGKLQQGVPAAGGRLVVIQDKDVHGTEAFGQDVQGPGKHVVQVAVGGQQLGGPKQGK
ncbi:UNVERIFIED_CONTAM: hypothetical protein ACS92_08500 [Bacillus cereus]